LRSAIVTCTPDSFISRTFSKLNAAVVDSGTDGNVPPQPFAVAVLAAAPAITREVSTCQFPAINSYGEGWYVSAANPKEHQRFKGRT
jgi:hypothetical protein